MKFYKLKDYDSLAFMDNKMLQVMVEDYVMALKKGSMIFQIVINHSQLGSKNPNRDY